ncbi:hypothetical protein BJY00DRAFT_270973 [Aspergillus carlsbadensis]|nr:hypothetical protein BJY00DRAFT_270973 [Aspergillus carlsbadensis]
MLYPNIKKVNPHSKMSSLYIGHLTQDTTDADIHSVLSQNGLHHGRVTVSPGDVKLVSKDRGRFAYAHFESPKEVTRAMHALNGVQINGNEVVLDHANDTDQPVSGGSEVCEGSEGSGPDPGDGGGRSGNDAGTTRLHPNYFYTADTAKYKIP